jgi:hypothetical protein
MNTAMINKISVGTANFGDIKKKLGDYNFNNEIFY